MNRTVRIRIALTAVLLAPASVRGFAQETAVVATSEKHPPLPDASVSQRVLLAAYPELRDRRIDWRIEVTDTARVVEARDAVLPVSPPSPSSTPVDPIGASALKALPTLATPPLVRAVVDLDSDGVVVALRVDGTLTRPAAFTAAQTAANPTEALRTAGAKFPPDDPAGPIGLVPDGVSRLLGSSGGLMPTFKPAAPGAVEGLTWQVELTEVTSKGTSYTYTVVFEPVEGRLLSIVRQ